MAKTLNEFYANNAFIRAELSNGMTFKIVTNLKAQGVYNDFYDGPLFFEEYEVFEKPNEVEPMNVHDFSIVIGKEYYNISDVIAPAKGLYITKVVEVIDATWDIDIENMKMIEDKEEQCIIV